MDINDLLKDLGVSKTELAQRLGIQEQNVNKLLLNPTEGTLNKIATALNVQPWELLAPKEKRDSTFSSTPSITCPHCGKPINIKVG